MTNDNSTRRNSDTALHIAIRNHQTHVASQLIRFGANVRAKNDRGETPLQLAVVNKSHIDPLTEMVPHGSQYDQMKFLRPVNSLRIAISSRDENTVRELATGNGATGVDHSLVKMLLDADADVNSTDVNGCSALHCAVYTGDVELVKTLIKAGADVNSQNIIGATALHAAVVCCNEAMVALLLDNGANVAAKILRTDETPLHWASMMNRNNSHGAIIRKLLKSRSDVNEKSNAAISFNRTPFLYILMHGDIDLVNLCIDQYQADLEQPTMDGSSPLAFALYNDDPRVRDMALVEIGTKGADGVTVGALNYASKLHRPEYVRQLIAKGADVNAKNEWRLTPLVASIIECWEEYTGGRPNLAEEIRQVIRLLLVHGADVNQKYGNKPLLHLALKSEFRQIRNVAPLVIIEYAVIVEEKTRRQVLDDCSLAMIDDDLSAMTHYEECQVELEAMKNDKIKGTTIPYFFVLMEPQEVVTWYAETEEFRKAFEASDYQSAYPIYGWWLKEKYEAANPKQKATEVVATKALSKKKSQCIIS